MTLKFYDIPQELIDIMLEHENYDALRSEYTKRPFGFKKAVKCGKIAQKKNLEFWQKVIMIYPELKNKNIYYEDGRLHEE